MKTSAHLSESPTPAERELAAYADAAFAPAHTVAGGRIHHFCGYAHSSMTVVEAETSLIVIDATESPDTARAVMAEVRAFTDKPVRTLVYTHGHPDHRGGAGAFRDTVEDVICMAPAAAPLPGYDRLGHVLDARGRRQHGYDLSDGDALCQGIGIREASTRGGAGYDPLPPTEVLPQERVARTIDGVELELVPAPGETDDTLYVWFPRERALCSADDYYACWPNLYAIRGTQYRSVAAWIESLDALLALGPEVLLPGHTPALVGRDLIREQVGTYRDAIAWVLDETLACMDKGMTLEETVRAVRLPERFASRPYLGEHYGTVAWSVRSIYVGYLGWFDGAPEHLDPVGEAERSRELVGLIGAERLDRRIDELMEEGSHQMALELLALGGVEDRGRRAACLERRAREMTSANARHYLMACAREAQGSGSDRAAGPERPR